MVSPALWIGPDYLSDEVERILFELDLQSQSTIFRTETPRVAGSLADLIETWWDLDALRRLHLTFQDNIRNLYPTPETSDRHAFVSYLRLIDSWRRIPYLDPGLPPSLLPADWPGQQSADEYLSLANQLSSRAWSHVQTVTANQ